MASSTLLTSKHDVSASDKTDAGLYPMLRSLTAVLIYRGCIAQSPEMVVASASLVVARDFAYRARST
jgi:hypothetical protein